MKQLRIKLEELEVLVKNYWNLDAETAKIVRNYIAVEFHEDYHV
jgi:hypothetical protein